MHDLLDDLYKKKWFLRLLAVSGIQDKEEES